MMHVSTGDNQHGPTKIVMLEATDSEPPRMFRPIGGGILCLSEREQATSIHLAMADPLWQEVLSKIEWHLIDRGLPKVKPTPNTPIKDGWDDANRWCNACMAIIRELARRHQAAGEPLAALTETVNGILEETGVPCAWQPGIDGEEACFIRFASK